MMIYLAEIEAYNLLTSTVEILRFSTGTGFADIAGGKYYQPNIEQPASLSREIFSDGKLSGRSSVSYGELLLTNADGQLDYLVNYATDGRTFTLKVGDDTAAYAAFESVLIGTMEPLNYELSRISIRLRDRIKDFETAFNTLKYAGDNVLPNGLEGVSDLKGKDKIRALGRPANVALTLVNSSLFIYHLQAGLSTSALPVWIKALI